MRRATWFLTLLTALTLPLAANAAAQDGSAVLDGACMDALDLCSVSCSALADEAQARGCRNRCDAGATACLGDAEVTLSSEEYLGYWGANNLAFKAAACHDTTPCPPEYSSCASWSGFSDCGDPFCGPSSLCKVCDEFGRFRLGPATRQLRERFRVCFNAQMQGCTEYQWASQTLSCGC